MVSRCKHTILFAFCCHLLENCNRTRVSAFECPLHIFRTKQLATDQLWNDFSGRPTKLCAARDWRYLFHSVNSGLLQERSSIFAHQRVEKKEQKVDTLVGMLCLSFSNFHGAHRQGTWSHVPNSKSLRKSSEDFIGYMLSILC